MFRCSRPVLKKLIYLQIKHAAAPHLTRWLIVYLWITSLIAITCNHCSFIRRSWYTLKHLLVTVAAKTVHLRLPEMRSEGVPFSNGRISPWLIKSSSNTLPPLSLKWWMVKKRLLLPIRLFVTLSQMWFKKRKEITVGLHLYTKFVRYKIFKLAPHLNNNLNNDDKWKLADPVFDGINQILTSTFQYISYYFLSATSYYFLCYLPLVTSFLCDVCNMRGE